MRLELILLAVFSAAWVLASLAGFGVLSLADTLDLDLYRLYSLATILGWTAGNLYVYRSRTKLPSRLRQRLLLSYFIGPPGILILIRTLAPQAAQHAAPLVPLYCFAVYALFFLVPVTLRATRTSRR